jgi:hypothetical protein
LIFSGACVSLNLSTGAFFMKKTVFPLLSILLMGLMGAILAGPVFAADEYTVESVIGKVEQELSPGKWQALAAGTILSPATVINTGLNAQLVLSIDGKYAVITAGQKGAVENLAGGASVSGFRIDGRAAESETGASSETSAERPARAANPE